VDVLSVVPCRGVSCQLRCCAIGGSVCLAHSCGTICLADALFTLRVCVCVCVCFDRNVAAVGCHVSPLVADAACSMAGSPRSGAVSRSELTIDVCTAPHHTTPHHTAPHRTAPHRTAPHHTALQRNATQRNGTTLAHTGGGSAIEDPTTGQWFLGASEISGHCGMQHWHDNSRCVLAVSSNGAGGPYERHSVVIDPWCHGASLARDPVSGRWIFG
jgi:hypothetical protein